MKRSHNEVEIKNLGYYMLKKSGSYVNFEIVGGLEKTYVKKSRM